MQIGLNQGQLSESTSLLLHPALPRLAPPRPVGTGPRGARWRGKGGGARFQELVFRALEEKKMQMASRDTGQPRSLVATG